MARTRDVRELLQDPAAAWDLGEPEARALLPRLAALQAVLAARLAAPGAGREPERLEQSSDKLLTAAEVALRLGLDVASVGRRRWPFRVKISRRCVRYSEAGLTTWLEHGRRS